MPSASEAPFTEKNSKQIPYYETIDMKRSSMQIDSSYFFFFTKMFYVNHNIHPNGSWVLDWFNRQESAGDSGIGKKGTNKFLSIFL